jgi:O-antigen ligase
MILAYIGKGAILGEMKIRNTPLDKPILLFLAVLAISLINSVDFLFGLKNYLRHLELFSIFYILSSGLKKNDIKNLIGFYLVITFVHALYNIFLFIHYGGAIRSFGIAGVPFADLVMPSLLFCCVSFFLAEDGRSQIKYGAIFAVLFGSLLITQTRGAIIGFTLSYLFISFLLTKGKKSLKLSGTRKRIVRLTLGMTAIIMLVIALHPSLFTGFSHRFYTLTQGPGETIQLRFLLWSLSLKAFLHSPILGIGLGQFTRIALIFPEVRFIPLINYISGMGAHNVVLSYLAETGIVGVLCLFYFMFSFLKLAWLKFEKSKTRNDLVLSSTLLGTLFFVAVSSFYAGEWFWSVQGMEFMIFLAFSVVYSR